MFFNCKDTSACKSVSSGDCIRGVSEKDPTCVYIIFFDCEGVVHYEFAQRGQTINNSIFRSKRTKRSVGVLQVESCSMNPRPRPRSRVSTAFLHEQ